MSAIGARDTVSVDGSAESAIGTVEEVVSHAGGAVSSGVASVTS